MGPCFPVLTCALLALSGATVAAGPEIEPPKEGRPCTECHPTISRAFSTTRMAHAAASADFVTEWNANGRAAYCIRCHAPSGGEGLVCADCHGPGPHPYPRVPVPQVCSHCHDAPGENTVRSFLSSPAAGRNEDCLSCHLESDTGGPDHAFRGPLTPGFLDDVARVRVFLRRDSPGVTTAVLQITHKAGHALPGGTTGRSVWLTVEGFRRDDTVAWRESIRFGWEHHPGEGWFDRTLPAGRPVVLELPNAARNQADHLRATLWYRFRAGPLEDHDPRTVLLHAQEMGLEQ